MSHGSGTGRNLNGEKDPVVISQLDQNATLLKLCSDMSELLKHKNAVPEENRVLQITMKNLKNLKFNENEAIDSFLTHIETVAFGYNLINDADKIKLAINILSTSSKGVKYLRLFNKKNLDNWVDFKEELYLMENLNRKVFQRKFRNYKRGPDEPVAVLMGELVDLYRKSMGYNSDYNFDERDVREIMEKFFECLESTVAMFGQQFYQNTIKFTQQDSLSKLRSIAKHCMEMESMDVSHSIRVSSTFNQVTQPSVMNVFKQKTGPIRTESQNDVKEIKQMLMNISTKMSSEKICDGKIMVPCKFWKQYKCSRGKRCRYLH